VVLKSSYLIYWAVSLVYQLRHHRTAQILGGMLDQGTGKRDRCIAAGKRIKS
jgi:hypothetical protein